jgi:hypothetical protein
MAMQRYRLRAVPLDRLMSKPDAQQTDTNAVPPKTTERPSKEDIPAWQLALEEAKRRSQRTRGRGPGLENIREPKKNSYQRLEERMQDRTRQKIAAEVCMLHSHVEHIIFSNIMVVGIISSAFT